MKNIIQGTIGIVIGAILAIIVISSTHSTEQQNSKIYSATVNCLDDGGTVTLSSNSLEDIGDAMLNYGTPGCTLINQNFSYGPHS